MYLSYRQAGFFAPRDLVVKTDVDPASLAATVRKAVWEIDKDQPVSNIRTMEEILADSIARQRFSMLLLAIFAAVAMILGRRRDLRCDELFGGPTHARDRHSHGARRADRRGA